MDYTEISNSIRMMIKAQGVDDKYIDKEETLYYDESGNIKHLIVKRVSLMQIQILYLCWVVFRRMILFLWKS